MQPKSLVLYEGIQQQLQVLVVQNAKFIVRSLLHHIELYLLEQLERMPPQGRAPFGGGELSSGKHLFRYNSGAYRCALCMINSTTGSFLKPCKGHTYKLGHRLWFLGSLHFCVRCGAYSGGRIAQVGRLHCTSRKQKLSSCLECISLGGSTLVSPSQCFLALQQVVRSPTLKPPLLQS